MYRFEFNGIVIATIRSKKLSRVLSAYYGRVLGPQAYVVMPDRKKIRCTEYFSSSEVKHGTADGERF